MTNLILPEACSPEKCDMFLNAAMVAPILAVDTEGTGLHVYDGRDYSYGVSIAYRDMKGDLQGGYIPIAHEEGNVSETQKLLLFQILRTRDSLIYHNAKYDLEAFLTLDLDLSDRHYYCTQLMAHMCNENIPSKGLDYLAKKELGIESGKLKDAEWEAYFQFYGWSPKFPAKVMARYAAGDAMLTYLLFERCYPFFKRQGFDG